MPVALDTHGAVAASGSTPSAFRDPDRPDVRFDHVGFRVVLPAASPSREP